MKREDFDKINNFFNYLALFLFESKDIDDYYYQFIILNDNFFEFFLKRYLKDGRYFQEIDHNNLSYQDVLNISRDIIKSINEDYLLQFDNLLNSGILDFSYDKEYIDSEVVHIRYKDGTFKRYININRKFNYDDVSTFIHEFMHYVSGIVYKIRNMIITEFISIYFELYANEYIFNNYSQNIKEIEYNKRLASCFERSKIIRNTEIPLFIFSRLGNLNEGSYKYVNDFFPKYNYEDYKYECEKTLNIINKEDGNGEKLYIYECHYYLIATFLAFYCRNNNNNICNILNLASNTNNKENDDLDLLNLLEKYNININSDIFKTIFDAMSDYLDIFEKEKARILN